MVDFHSPPLAVRTPAPCSPRSGSFFIIFCRLTLGVWRWRWHSSTHSIWHMCTPSGQQPQAIVHVACERAAHANPIWYCAISRRRQEKKRENLFFWIRKCACLIEFSREMIKHWLNVSESSCSSTHSNDIVRPNGEERNLHCSALDTQEK